MRCLPYLLQQLTTNDIWASTAGSQGGVGRLCSVLLDVLQQGGRDSAPWLRRALSECVAALRDQGLLLDLRVRVADLWLRGNDLYASPMLPLSQSA